MNILSSAVSKFSLFNHMNIVEHIDLPALLKWSLPHVIKSIEMCINSNNMNFFPTLVVFNADNSAAKTTVIKR